MTEKRYFEKMWEEEFYIFDSNTISERDFEEKLEYQGYKAFEDSMIGDEVVNRLNELHDENKKLKSINQDHKDHLADFYADYSRLEKENLDLSEELDYYKTKCASLETGLFQADRENEQLKTDNNRLVNETAKIVAEHHKKVFELIDKKLNEDKKIYKMTYESELKGRIEVLEELKKELQE